MPGVNLVDPEDRSVAAGEYVLGSLDAEARRTVLEAIARDRGLLAEVYFWQDRLLGLVAPIVPTPPAAEVWLGIAAGIARSDARTEARTDAGTDAGTSATPPGIVVGARDGDAANDRMFRRLRRWQGIGGLAIAAVCLLALVLVLRPLPSEPRYLAVLQAPDRSVGWVVEASAGGSVRLVPVGSSAPVPAGKALQFWTKAPSAAGPTSLGLVSAGQVTVLPAARLPNLEPQQLFELTLEPEAGSPTGRPTGPVLFVGRTTRL